MHRRDLLCAVGAMPAAALADRLAAAPLPTEHLRVLALCASPPPATLEEYDRVRLVPNGEVQALLADLEARGLILRKEREEEHCIRPFFVATDNGRAALARIGIHVEYRPA